MYIYGPSTERLAQIGTARKPLSNLPLHFCLKGIDARYINKLSRQLPRSSDVHVRVYSFDGRHCLCAVRIAQYAIIVEPAKCGHAAKMLAAHERHYDFITFLGITRVALSMALTLYITMATAAGKRQRHPHMQ